MYQFPIRFLTLASILTAPTAFAANFNITPAANYPMPEFISPGETVSAYYLVINNTSTTRTGYTIQGLPAAVRQITNNSSFCPRFITLASGTSCTLALQITAPVTSNFALCKGTSCTTAAVPLNVKERAALTGFRSSVGYYKNTAGGTVPLSYTSINRGMTWTLSAPLVLPTDAAKGANASSMLSDLSCNSAAGKQCSAVGLYKNTAGGNVPLSYTSINGGVSWTQSSPLALPTDAAKGANARSELYDIACDSATGKKCTAVGIYKNTVNGLVPLSYTSINGGVSWTVQSAPLVLPPDAAIGANAYSTLSGITCDSATGKQCSAVGIYKNNVGGFVSLSYTSSNGGVTWIQSTPLVLPADAATGADASSALFGITCDSATSKRCSTVGFYKNTVGDLVPLSYTSINGGVSWTVQSAPLALPSDAATGAHAVSTLSSITCDSATGKQCSAVGSYQNTVGAFGPLSYTSINGGVSWIVQSAPLALPADAAKGADAYSTLSNITCDSATSKQCSAVGTYRNTDGGRVPLSYTSVNGGVSWTVQSSPLAPPTDAAKGADASSGLNGVK